MASIAGTAYFGSEKPFEYPLAHRGRYALPGIADAKNHATIVRSQRTVDATSGTVVLAGIVEQVEQEPAKVIRVSPYPEQRSHGHF